LYSKKLIYFATKMGICTKMLSSACCLRSFFTKPTHNNKDTDSPSNSFEYLKTDEKAQVVVAFPLKKTQINDFEEDEQVSHH